MLCVSSAIDIPFGDKDQEGDYTLMPGDLVEFNIATDRRDKLQRATHIELVLDTFKVNTEKREKVRFSAHFLLFVHLFPFRVLWLHSKMAMDSYSVPIVKDACSSITVRTWMGKGSPP
jgi:hypothetical protein